jgi:pyruvate-formate lyase-activating enzyme
MVDEVEKRHAAPDTIHDTRQKLEQVSPSFCLAKWLQVTLHLHNGHTHSCHHPDTHKVSLKELKNDPSALHNTQFKKRLRKEMLNGKRPKECDYCWRIEDSSKTAISDRVYKSHDSWARPLLNKVAQAPWDQNFDPTYLELNFGNLCNMKCAYCSPQISSSWMAEIEKFGDYPVDTAGQSLRFLKSQDKMPWAGSDETNPYIQAFWKWWPDLRPNLKTLRITGGEPLLNDNTFRLLKNILEHPRSELHFAVNTNLMIPKSRLDQFIAAAEKIQARGNVQKLSVYTSLDAWGERAAYIRHGLRPDYFWANVERVLAEIPNVELVFMCTFNCLSVTSFKPFLDHFLSIRKRHPSVYLDISYLRHPEHLSTQVLTPDFTPMLAGLVEYMKSRRAGLEPGGFIESEIEKMRRLHEWVLVSQDDIWMRHNQKNFYLFFKEHDQRRQTDFLSTFPEMFEFWHHCRKLVEAAAKGM